MSLRDDNKAQLEHDIFDVLIVGGGINGAVSAAALSAKGAKVALIDKGDFAGMTSSNSSNLAWGGIKYLESHEYLLVNKLCRSRNHLMRHYPSTVQEIRFLTSIQKGFRFPPFLIYLATLLYWVFGRFYTRPPSLFSAKGIKLRESAVDITNCAGGFEYSDAYLFDNDARFVFSFIRSALDSGCCAVNYMKAEKTQRDNGLWSVCARDEIVDCHYTIRAKVLINAAGPYVDDYNALIGEDTLHHHVFSKGVHLIVDKITDSKRVLAFFASDGRLFFVIPMGEKTCIGTTDTQVPSPATQVTEEDRQFILDNANALLDLKQPLAQKDIIAERCGVRPLAVKDEGEGCNWVQLSRKHAIDINKQTSQLSIFGGKLTDCINVGNEVASTVSSFGIELSKHNEVWYGEPPKAIRNKFFALAKSIKLNELTTSDASESLSLRFWRRYGADAFKLLDAVKNNPSQATVILKNTGYTRCEIEYAANNEMIVKLEDFLRRRSDISLLVKREELISGEGLQEVCRILFGSQAQDKLNEYIGLTSQ